MEVEPNIKGGSASTEMGKFLCEGNDVVEFKLVRELEDIDDDNLGFQPEMCHQVFNETEKIFGYENLKIKAYFTSGSLEAYLAVDYKSKISQKMTDGVEADDVTGKMSGVLRGGFTRDINKFKKMVGRNNRFIPFGSKIHSFKCKVQDDEDLDTPPTKKSKKDLGNNDSWNTKSYEIFMADAVSVPGFKEYVKRMESFILFYIDAATFLDCDEDEKWKFFTMFEKYKTEDGLTAYEFVGYSSVYQFYTYPDLMRPRVAQMLILPPFQGQGLGSHLLSTIYDCYRKNPKTKEITVEDPSDTFEMLRDFVDARDCKKLSSYAPKNLKKGFSSTMADEAHNTLKMTKRQARRMYEILRLQFTNVKNESEFREFRLDVKRRLNIPYQKQESDLKRMLRRKIVDPEIQKATALDDCTRKTELESNFQLLMTHYEKILKRLEKYCQ